MNVMRSVTESELNLIEYYYDLLVQLFVGMFIQSSVHNRRTVYTKRHFNTL